MGRKTSTQYITKVLRFSNKTPV